MRNALLPSVLVNGWMQKTDLPFSMFSVLLLLPLLTAATTTAAAAAAAAVAVMAYSFTS